jgi:hypothetical protein
MIHWWLKEATANDRRLPWGGLALDFARNTLFHRPRRLYLHWCLMDMFSIIYVSLQENLEMTVKNGKHKLIGLW